VKSRFRRLIDHIQMQFSALRALLLSRLSHIDWSRTVESPRRCRSGKNDGHAGDNFLRRRRTHLFRRRFHYLLSRWNPRTTKVNEINDRVDQSTWYRATDVARATASRPLFFCWWDRRSEALPFIRTVKRLHRQAAKGFFRSLIVVRKWRITHLQYG